MVMVLLWNCCDRTAAVVEAAAMTQPYIGMTHWRRGDNALFARSVL
jgi:hypothetical protein